jgi:hypothetical protein
MRTGQLVTVAIGLCIAATPATQAQVRRAPHAAVAQLPSASTTELSIIAAAVDSLYMRDGVGRVVVISPTAVLRGDVLRDEVTRLSVPREAADDIAGRNTVSVDIRGLASLVTSRIPVSFLDSDSVNKTPRPNPDAFWKAFFAAYPGAKGIVTVSRPGISADGQSAVLRIGMGCGGRCGTWGFALLRRIGDRWHVARFVIARVS